jgi:hypothetical protein
MYIILVLLLKRIYNSVWNHINGIYQMWKFTHRVWPDFVPDGMGTPNLNIPFDLSLF